MKAGYTLITFLFFSIYSFAQVQHQWTPYTGYKQRYEAESETLAGRKTISNQNIKSITTLRINSKGDTSKSAIAYTKDGFLNTYIWFNKDVPVKKTYAYNTYGKINEVKSYNKKGNLTWESLYSFNLDTLVTEYLHKRKQKVYSKRTIEYAGKKITSTAYYYKSNPEPKTEYKYTFYDDGSRKETNYYKKGKLKYTWNFDCKSEGEIVQKHKDTAQICSWIETDSEGRVIKWMQTTNEDNKIRKTKSIFENETDKNPVAFYSYNFKGILVYSWEKSKEKYKYSRYNKKGELESVYESFYDDLGREKNNQWTSFKKSKKQTSKTEYQYNEEGLKIAETFTNYKGKVTNIKYVYELY